MTHKTSQCYNAVFKFVEEKVMELKPKSFMTDWEEGLRKSLRECWPNATIRGCWWHYKRAINKKCMNAGLRGVLNKSYEARKVKKMLGNIPLLPKELIVEGYKGVKNYARKKNLTKSFRKVFTYYEQYWLNYQVCYYSNINLRIILHGCVGC